MLMKLYKVEPDMSVTDALHKAPRSGHNNYLASSWDSLKRFTGYERTE